MPPEVDRLLGDADEQRATLDAMLAEFAAPFEVPDFDADALEALLREVGGPDEDPAPDVS